MRFFSCKAGEALLDTVNLAGLTGRIQAVPVRGQHDHLETQQLVERSREIVVDPFTAAFLVGRPPDRFLRRSGEVVAVIDLWPLLVQEPQDH